MNKPGESILSVPYVFYKEHDGGMYKYRPGCYWKFRHYSADEMAKKIFEKECDRFIEMGLSYYADVYNLEEDHYENDN